MNKIRLIFLIILLSCNMKAEDVEFKATGVQLFKGMTKEEIKKVELKGEAQGNSINKLMSGEKPIQQVQQTVEKQQIQNEKNVEKKTEVAGVKIEKKEEKKVKQLPKTEQLREVEEVIVKNDIIPIETVKISNLLVEATELDKQKVFITQKGNIIYDIPKKQINELELMYGEQGRVLVYTLKQYKKPKYISNHVIIRKRAYTVENLVKDKRGEGFGVKITNLFSKEWY